MPTPHGGSGLPSLLLAVLVAAAVAAALWTHRHKLAQLHQAAPETTTAPEATVDTTDGPPREDQGAIPFDGFDPDQIYGPPIDDTSA